MFGLFRLLGIVVALSVAAIVIDPSWNGGARELTLRVRSVGECIAVVRSVGDRFASERLARRDAESGRSAKREPARARPAVAAGPVRADEGPQESLTRDERARLDRLIEEKTRED
jgi:hypothetical protein